jgi:hypothetical protein
MIATFSKEINFFMASGIDQFRETTQAKFQCKYIPTNTKWLLMVRIVNLLNEKTQ